MDDAFLIEELSAFLPFSRCSACWGLITVGFAVGTLLALEEFVTIGTPLADGSVCVGDEAPQFVSVINIAGKAA